MSSLISPYLYVYCFLHTYSIAYFVLPTVSFLPLCSSMFIFLSIHPSPSHYPQEGLTQANVTSGALLFHACRFRPPEKTKAWRAKEHFWHNLACHRLSQASHVLRHMAGADEDRTQFLDRVKQQCSNKEAQLGIYQALFGASANTKKDIAGSFFLCDEEFVTAPLLYPEADQVKEWDQGRCRGSWGYWTTLSVWISWYCKR